MSEMLTIIVCLAGLFSPYSFQSLDVGEYLHQVDDSIVKWLKDPSTQSKTEVFSMVKDYLDTLQNFIDKIDLKKNSAVKPGETLLKRKQPHYLEEPFPEEKLKTQDGWNPEDIDKLQRLFKNCDLQWQDFEKSYADMLKYKETNQESDSLMG